MKKRLNPNDLKKLIVFYLTLTYMCIASACGRTNQNQTNSAISSSQENTSSTESATHSNPVDNGELNNSVTEGTYQDGDSLMENVGNAINQLL